MKNQAKFWMMLFSILPSLLIGQEIKLTNSSFEDVPQHSTTPYGWHNCGDLYESPPDIQPGWFQVDKDAHRGKSYLGLVTRDNDTWEGVSQRLSKEVVSGECYKFNIYLAKATKYISLSKSTMKEENFKDAVRLRIWGGNSHCHKKELLAQTGPIAHTTWKKYDLEFKPKANHRFLFVEAYFKQGAFFPYNGNLLVDNMSSIKACKEPDEPEEEPIVVVEDPVDDKKPDVVIEEPKETVTKVDVVEDVTKVDIATVKKGTVIRTKGIQFPPDQAAIQMSSIKTLNEIYDLLKRNPDLVIEVGGHTNGIPDHEYCDNLSRERAKSVAEYLITKKGIPRDRVKYRGYGKRQPIATNETKEGRTKNQRVEIKILSLKG